MNKQYDFSNAIKNPYIKKLKKQITIRLDHETISYFKGLANEYGMPYQNLINMYLHSRPNCRHTGESRYPEELSQRRYWIPAFAGMTSEAISNLTTPFST